MFFKGSRYEFVDEAEITDGTKRTIRYKRIRFTPETKTREQHSVCQDERLDNIAYRYFRDPELFWRICDANPVLWPDDLLSEVGRSIGVPPAEG
ncbi:MAG: hypothetical protein WBM17_12865 [Anaerolineales bacterium]